MMKFNKVNKIDFKTIEKRIIESNTNTSKNGNLYPIQEQATLREIWEYVPCACNNNCNCKKFNCEFHWKLKENLEFYDILPSFLRMFVDKKWHIKLIEWIERKQPLPEKVSVRIKDLVPILIEMRDNWGELYKETLNNNKTLICDNWYNDFFKKEWDFSVRPTSVYRAKQYCILLPDICVPYDSQSRNKILRNFKINTYYHMLNELRKWIIHILISENQIIHNFRKLDSPQEQLPFNHKLVLLRKLNFDYGESYIPDERPISRGIDKFFYQPSANEKIIEDNKILSLTSFSLNRHEIETSENFSNDSDSFSLHNSELEIYNCLKEDFSSEAVCTQIANKLNIGVTLALNRLKKLESKGLVKETNDKWQIAN